MSKGLSVVGKRFPRRGAHDLATGSAQYGADMKLSGMLIGKVLMSPYPHAKILKIDKSKAEKLPGVEVVITIDDVPKKAFTKYLFDLLEPGQMVLEAEAHHGPLKDEHVFNNKARFVGDAVAAVAAINISTAEKALELIEVEYEKLPAVFNPIEAMKPDAPRIHDYAKDNIAKHLSFGFPTGDVGKGFQESDYILEKTFHNYKQKMCQLEPNVCVASFDSSGRLTVWSPCQEPHLARTKMAYIFDIPEGMIRWLTSYVGGAFGGRQSFTNEPICVALAKKAGKPVKLEYTRDEDFITSESRQPITFAGKLGVKTDGTITAIQVKSITDAGAYFTHSGGTTGCSLLFFLGLYRCPNLAGEADIVYTNTHISGGFRGYGNVQAAFALEQLSDMAAEKIGMDPMEFRLRNIKGTGEPSLFNPPMPIENSALDECIKLGMERIGWREKRVRRKEGVRRQGVGMACVQHCSGVAGILVEHSSAFIKLNGDGSANLMVGSCDMGQNIFGALAQIAAEELGLNAEDIHMVTGDTDVTQFDSGSFASRSTYNMGNAVLRAARQVKGQLLERVAKELRVSTKELAVKDRRIYVKATSEKGISIAEVSRNAIYNSEGECLDISGRCSWSPEQASPSFQATFAEVEVDTQTGEVKLIKIVIADDIGQAVNPTTVEGQLEGGIVQGIGYALTEDFVIDMNTGVCLTDNFETYRIPTTFDLPEIEVILVEQPVSSGPFGAKSVGEIGMIAVAPAIANAIYNATGVRMTKLPMTPERIRKALRAKNTRPSATVK